MRVSEFRCDRCGVSLDMHGDRYVMRIDKVPRVRSGGGVAYDLCPVCAGQVKVEIARRADRRRNHEPA